MEKEIDRIIELHNYLGHYFSKSECVLMKSAMKEFGRQLIPIILKEAAERAKMCYYPSNRYVEDSWAIDEESITSLEAELIEKMKLK